MKKHWRIIFALILITILMIVLVSCSSPKNNSTDPENPASPPGQINPPEPTSLQTVEPGPGTPDAIEYSPEIGSLLRWVDLSDFVYVPPDEFIMGADSQIFTDFRPAHLVGMGGFWIQQAEVTNQQYALCVAAGVCSAPFMEKDVDYWYADPANANKPVVGVSWYQAQEYCTYIKARLPTEAEWEITARGTEGRNFPWGDDEPTCDLLNFNDCLDPSEPQNVRSYNNGASPFEAMDMSGNVFEWVADWYKEDYYPESPDFNPPGPLESELKTEDKEKVYRGGGFATSLDKISPILRLKAKPEEHAADLGFRCVLLGEGSHIEIPVPAPACQVAASNRQPKNEPTYTPYVVPLPEIYGYCNKDANGNKNTRVEIINQVDRCWTGFLQDFSINIPNDSSAITCAFQASIIGCSEDVFKCTSPHFMEGAFIGINFCYGGTTTEPYYENPECAAGFAYNFDSGWCEPVNDWLPVPPCPVGYEQNGSHCLPTYDSFHGCPVGYYSVLNHDWSMTCSPADPCLWTEQTCLAEPFCLDGQNYDAENQCCAALEPLKAMCHTGMYFDPDTQMCEYSPLYSAECASKSVQIPYCATETPTPTPLNCSNLDKTTCGNTHGCEWYVPASGGKGYCR